MFGATVLGATPFGGTPLFEAEIEKRVGEKSIVEISSLVGSELLKHFAADPDKITGTSPRHFEESIAELFRRFGYTVELTKRTRDGGVDVIAVAHREVQVKYLIECKHAKSGNPITLSAVRELHGVDSAEGTTKAVLATTGRFSRDAQLFVEQSYWELERTDFYGIKDWIARYRALEMTRIGTIAQQEGAEANGEPLSAAAESDPFLQAVSKTAKPRPHWPKDYALNHGHYVSREPKKS